MVYNHYSHSLRDKIKTSARVYERFIFKKAGELKNTAKLETTEHLRTVPETGLTAFEGGFRWGGEWKNLWVVGDVTVPEEAAGKKLYAVPKTGAVEILFFIDGKPAGIFNSKNDFFGGMHSAQLICDNAVPGTTYKLAFECYADHFCAGTQPFERYGRRGNERTDEEFMRNYEGIDICIMDETVKDFLFDLKAVMQLAEVLPENNFMRSKARNALERMFPVFVQYPADVPEEVWREGIVKAREILAEVLSIRGSDGQRGIVGVIGHSHMDTAWLWPVSETIRKCARTYSNALSLMKQYPEYKFVQPSVLHLDWMRRYYPDIFEEIKKQTAAGRYEPNGGVWVECDCNITSGESMVRQFLHGQLYTRKYLGYEADSFWLPDTFGYNAAIPQIMKQCNVKYFYTQKIAWGDLTEFPYDTFIWRGIDGTEVLTHFNRMHCFPDVKTTVEAVNDIKRKEVFDGRLVAFGFGDGGGGPTYGMLEDHRRAAGLAGIPEQYYCTISEFMQDIEKNAVNLPVYSGELYLETHRGTLTSIHNVKRDNRKAEFALRDMEFLGVAAGKPKHERSDELLEVLLINQFHDILPGTSINEVNEQTKREMDKLIYDLKTISNEYAAELTEQCDKSVTFFNTLSFKRNDNIYIENFEGCLEGAKVQKVTDIMGRNIAVVGGVELDAFGAKTLAVTDAACEGCESPFKFDGTTLETPHLVVKFGEGYGIESLVDKKTGREVRRPGSEPLGTFWMGEDVPQSWDNWNIDYDQKFKMKPTGKLVSREVAADGPAEFRVRQKVQLTEKTSLVQDIIFSATSPRVDFHTAVDWNEKHQLLKVGFDVDVYSQVIKNEIQFGHFDRPTTSNNEFEAAKFEVCNHKWSDLSESRFGVALLNDCKYGISCFESDMRLSLLKSGTRPDTTGDAGLHEMTYSLLPHEGAFSAETVVREAYMLNVPVFVAKGSLKAGYEAPVLVSAPNVIVEAVKPAELIENAYVIRLYECERNKTVCDIKFPSRAKAVYAANMLEDLGDELPLQDGTLKTEFRPFEIKTFVVKY
ncbi:MAG: alpha-mannosidase [Clostridiales bacterium]|nr:alpha-mannosidase [Clostridiales bacterium]